MTAVDYHSQTTLVTGASSGIGAVFARELSARGSDLVLVARREDRLTALARDLTAQHGTRVEVFAADLSEFGAGTTVAKRVADHGITVTSLINNAGFGTHGSFHEEDLDRLRQEIAANVSAVVELTHALLPQLRAAGSGVLVNVASMAAYQADPYMAVYGATKAFVLSFTEAVWYESRGTGLKVMAVSPGATETEFFDVVGTSDQAAGSTRKQTPQQVVAETLRALDRRKPPPSMAVGRANRTLARLGRLTSRKFSTSLIGRMTQRSSA